MAVKWTEKQQQVIDSRNRNLLVSAAAGSGKTAVLVERIIRMISEGDHPLDIDQLLVMTFLLKPLPMRLRLRCVNGLGRLWRKSLRSILRMSICGFRQP